MEKIGQSGREWIRKIEGEKEGVEQEVERKLKDITGQIWNQWLERFRYVGELRNIIGKDKGIIKERQ